MIRIGIEYQEISLIWIIDSYIFHEAKSEQVCYGAISWRHHNCKSYRVFAIYYKFDLLFSIRSTRNSFAATTTTTSIKATNIYQTHTIVLGKDSNNLVIIIPDEGHEQPNQSPRELRIINQPYIPQNAVVNVGTTVT